MTWLLVPLAFAAMFTQDVLGVWLVRAETQGSAHAAARWDTLQDACRIAGLYAGMDALLLSRDLPLKAAVIAATLAADYLGTHTGVRLSNRRKPAPVEISWQCGVGADKQFAEYLKRHIRRNGGNPGAMA